jgi:flavin reductase (DIM6/NTAB) family NADH-FMN oxidoreductase RutF
MRKTGVPIMTTSTQVAAPAATRPQVPSIDADGFRSFMSHWPTGVTVITSYADRQPVGCTVNAMMSVSLTPPLLVVALSYGSRTLDAIGDAGAFGLHVLGAGQQDICRQFAHGTPQERFRGVGYDERHHVPVLRDVFASTVCRVHDTISCGDHLLVVGEPVWHTTGGDESPLLFHRRGYHGVS